MVQKIVIKNRWTGEVIFSHECEDNTIKKTVEAAIWQQVNLSDSDLSGSNLRGVRYNECTAFFALQCPEEGEFIAWKKVKGCIVKLLIPADAQRSSATSRKCRASKAHVLAIYDEDGNDKESVVSDSYVTTTYTVGEDVLPDSWDDDRWNECSHGIHFFITRREAELYN